MTSIDPQSPDIAQGVDTAFETRTGTSGEDILNSQGAGDQGMMFGYACDETDDLMPLPIWLAHRLAHRLSEVRKAGILPYLRPDGKTQVTFDYEDGRPVRLKTVLISTQHAPGLDAETLIKPDLVEHVIRPLIPPQFQDDDYEVYVNPTGTFELGGPHADCGLTGRKIIVDTYGGAARHGGGAFSGKDPSKVDRSAAYAARWVAKNVVAAGAATPLRGAGGLRHRRRPAGVAAGRDVRHRDRRRATKLTEAVEQVFDLRPAAILRDLDLRRPIYKKTAAYGHFGRADKEFTWEQTDPGRRPEVGARPLTDLDRPGPARTCRRSSRTFDYLVPDAVRDQVRVGTIVRVELHGRRVGGWVVERRRRRRRGGVGAQAARQGVVGGPAARGRRPGAVGGVALGRPLGPPPAHRLAARRRPPAACRRQLPRMARQLPPVASCGGCRRRPTGCRSSARRSPPGRRSSSCPSVDAAARLAGRLRRDGHRVALLAGDVRAGDWALAASGEASVVGTRVAVWAPIPDAALPVDRRARRARRGAAVRAGADVARPRRRRRAGPPGRACRARWCRRCRRCTRWRPGGW